MIINNFNIIFFNIYMYKISQFSLKKIPIDNHIWYRQISCNLIVI